MEVSGTVLFTIRSMTKVFTKHHESVGEFLQFYNFLQILQIFYNFYNNRPVSGRQDKDAEICQLTERLWRVSWTPHWRSWRVPYHAFAPRCELRCFKSFVLCRPL